MTDKVGCRYAGGSPTNAEGRDPIDGARGLTGDARDADADGDADGTNSCAGLYAPRPPHPPPPPGVSFHARACTTRNTRPGRRVSSVSIGVRWRWSPCRLHSARERRSDRAWTRHTTPRRVARFRIRYTHARGARGGVVGAVGEGDWHGPGRWCTCRRARESEQLVGAQSQNRRTGERLQLSVGTHGMQQRQAARHSSVIARQWLFFFPSIEI